MVMRTQASGGIGVCRRKTARGNIYCSRKKARQAAQQMRCKLGPLGSAIQEFRCGYCEQWHIGTLPAFAQKDQGVIRR